MPEEQALINKEELINEARGCALREVVAWLERRAKFQIAHGPNISSVAREERRARAAEAEAAASYFRKLPEAEALLNAPSEVGSDAATTAFRILYERPIGETNAEFLLRAEQLIQEACDVGGVLAISKLPLLEANMPENWRLESVQIYQDKEKKYQAKLFKHGGEFMYATGPTTIAAVNKAVKKIVEHLPSE